MTGTKSTRKKRKDAGKLRPANEIVNLLRSAHRDIARACNTPVPVQAAVQLATVQLATALDAAASKIREAQRLASEIHATKTTRERKLPGDTGAKRRGAKR